MHGGRWSLRQNALRKWQMYFIFDNIDFGPRSHRLETIARLLWQDIPSNLLISWIKDTYFVGSWILFNQVTFISIKKKLKVNAPVRLFATVFSQTWKDALSCVTSYLHKISLYTTRWKPIAGNMLRVHSAVTLHPWDPYNPKRRPQWCKCSCSLKTMRSLSWPKCHSAKPQ